MNPPCVIRAQLPSDGAIVEVRFQNQRQAEEFVACVLRGDYLAFATVDPDARDRLVLPDE